MKRGFSTQHNLNSKTKIIETNKYEYNLGHILSDEAFSRFLLFCFSYFYVQ